MPGSGQTIGDALVQHPLVRKISFTGSTSVGARIMALAAPGIKRISLELGGKSPNIVFADADWRQAAETSPMSVFANTGQDCCARSRLFVERSILEPFVEAFVAATRKLVVDDPLKPETQIGPLVSASQRESVEAYLSGARAAGRTIATGGARPKREGYFLEPAVLLEVEPGDRCWQEEIFGPVVCIRPFEDEAAMIREVNASPYGLSGSIWTNNLRGRCGSPGRSRAACSASIRTAASMSRPPLAASSRAAWDATLGCRPSKAIPSSRTSILRRSHEPADPPAAHRVGGHRHRAGRLPRSVRAADRQAVRRRVLPRSRGPARDARLQLPADREPGNGPARWVQRGELDAGFGDFAFQPDLATLRVLPWQPGAALVLAIWPRRTAAGGRGAAVGACGAQSSGKSGMACRCASELEFYLFQPALPTRPSRPAIAICNRRAITASTTTSCSRRATNP